MTILFTEPSFVPVSGNSVVYPGAKLYFYETGTSNLQNTYSEYTLTTAHANPVVADADGRFAPIYLDPSLEDYKVVLKDSSDVTIWTVDPYSAGSITANGSTVSDLLATDGTINPNVRINGYHTAGDGGGGEFYWDASQDKANHNGGTIIDPDVTFPSDWTNQTQVATWFTAGTGTGCWVRIYDVVDVRKFGAKGDASTDDTLAIQAARDHIASSGEKLVFPEGTYVYSTSPNWAIANSVVEFDGIVRLRYTGSGNCLDFDTGASGLTFNVKFGWVNKPLVEGSSSAQNGVYVRSVHHSKIGANIRGCSAAALRVEFSVVNEYDIVCSINQGAFYGGGTPANGIYLTRRGTGAEYCSANTFYNPIIEGMSGAGIYLDWAIMNTFIGGTSEANAGINIDCTANSRNNLFHKIDLEVSGVSQGFVDRGRHNTWSEIFNDALSTFSATCIGGTLRGGQIDAVSIASGAKGVTLQDFAYGSDSGNITDAGDLTTITGAYDLVSATFDVEKIRGRTDFTQTITVGAFVAPATSPGIVTKTGVVCAGAKIGDNIRLQSQTALASDFIPQPYAVCTADGTIDISCVQLTGTPVSPLPSGADMLVTVNGV